MRRIVASSVLFGLALAAVALAQPGANADKKPADKKAVEQKADPADAAIAAALAHDPDVRMARAKVQLAEAELAKARQSVTVKVVTLRATIEEQKAAVAIAEESFAVTDRMFRVGQGAMAELIQVRAKLEVAKAGLARAELELKLITGGGPVGAAAGDPAAVAHGLDWLANRMHEGKPSPADAVQQRLYAEWLRGAASIDQPVSVRGAVPDRIRAALDKKVKIGEKGQKVPLTKALEVFKADAGLDVPVRGVGDLVVAPTVTSQGEEMTVRAWLQLYEDYSGGGRFYVREYGLLFTHREQAPPDALTLTQFGEMRPPAKKDEKPKDAADKK